MNKRLTSFAAAMVLMAASLTVAPPSVEAQPQAGLLQQSGSVSVTIPSLNVRSGPSYNDDIVGLMSGGSTARVLAQSNDGLWLKIDYQGYQAWILKEFTTSAAPVAAAPAAATAVPVAAAPAAAATAVPVAAAPASTSSVSPNGEFANVRTGPGFDNDIINTLNSGQSVPVIGRMGEWFKVTFQGKTAYIFNGVVNESVSAAAAPGSAATTASAAAASSGISNGATPNVDRMNVRAGSNFDADIVGSLTRGSVVRVLATEGEWLRVDYQGYQAYIYAPLTTKVAPAAPAAPAAAAPAAAAPSGPTPSSGAIIITKYAVEVRSAPNGGNVLANVGPNSAIYFVSMEGAFAKVTSGNQTGYVPGDSFVAYSGAPPGSAPAAAPAPAPAASAPALSAPAPSAPVSTVSSGAFEMGAHIKDPEKLDMIKGNGMDWVKVQIVAPGGAPNIKGLLDQYHGAGLKVLIGLIGDRGRAPDTGYHNEFAGVAAEIAKQGADAIEIWNEPNLDREWGGGGAGKVNPDQYANMLKLAYNAIKAVNSGVMVVAAASAPTGYAGGNCRGDVCDDKPFVERLRAAGAANYMDCMGAHHNGTMVGPDQRSGAPVGSSDHPQWYFWGTLDTTYNAIGGKPICWTELGYVTKDGIAPTLPGGFSWGNSITLGNQAEWLARAVTLSRQSGKVRLMIIWNWNFRQFDSDPQSGFSIYRPDGSCPACGQIKAAMGR